MSADKFVGRSSVLQLGGSVLILKRYKRNGREETSELVAIDVDTLEDIEALAARTGHRLKWPTDLAVTA